MSQREAKISPFFKFLCFIILCRLTISGASIDDRTVATCTQFIFRKSHKAQPNSGPKFLTRDARSAKPGITTVSWTSSILITQIISLRSWTLKPQHRQSSPKDTPQNAGGIGLGVDVLNRKPAISLKRGKVWPSLLLMTNRRLHTRFRLEPKSVTLDDLEGPLRTLFQNTCVFRSSPRKSDVTDGRTDRRLTIAIPRFALPTSRCKNCKVCYQICYRLLTGSSSQRKWSKTINYWSWKKQVNSWKIPWHQLSCTACQKILQCSTVMQKVKKYQ